MRATFGTGPVGTGAYLVGEAGSWADPREVEVWLLFLFFPVLPLARWRVAAVGGDGRDGEALVLTVHSKSRVAVQAALWRLGKAVLASVLTVLPLAFGIWTLGLPWATSLLTGILGVVVSAGILGKLGMAIEVGTALFGGALPILVLMHLDQLTPRIPMRFATGIGK